MEKFVAVAGNIGVGKTTLVQRLCDNLGWTPFFEPESDNPYLPDFYQDMQTWAFHSQVFFLTRRLRAHKNLCTHPGSVIQDRSVYEDAKIFAHNLYQQKQMGERDYQTYGGKRDHRKISKRSPSGRRRSAQRRESFQRGGLSGNFVRLTKRRNPGNCRAGWGR